MTTLESISTLEHGTLIDALAWNALLEDPQPERPLFWYESINGQATEWQELQGISHLAQLINGLPEDQDFMVVQDDDPETRYAQSMRLENGKFTVELAMFLPNGALNLRVGKGVAAISEPNRPDEVATLLQELSPAEAVQILMSWASGRGLPAGYAGSIYSYV
ncbi:hypothetical protein [Paeniglutamicibacter terrestris]|uniref:Uncharacterized protein n=1 Tax=Paeniglutamicibacter terrestris TaxID=2723403 RepID=A0ABX1G0Y7_9MICC|nr:hypothetical protein [Paeniglutamicibacter terrestris]NKG19889.1 hypothetical protein [Paeniglutamicibacter terrestris]